MALGRSEQLTYTTVKVVTQSADGSVGSGTAFALRLEREETYIPILVTNKHVVDAAQVGLLQFTLTRQAEDGPAPDVGKTHSFRMKGFQHAWVRHPDPEVDLAAMPLAPLLASPAPSGQLPFIITFSSDVVATQEDLDALEVCDDIVMVGYPNGLADEANNLPIVRRGITASAPGLNFQGKPIFAIDCACYPGSSGSPVVLFDKHGYVDRNGNHHLGENRLKLIGVLASGPRMTATGEVQVVPIPTSAALQSRTPIMMNLGYCMKSTQLRFFHDHFFQVLDQSTPTQAVIAGEEAPGGTLGEHSDG